MQSLSISRRIAAAFALILVLIAALAATSMLTNRSIADTGLDVAQRRVMLYGAANDLAISVLQSARHTRNMLILDADRLQPEIDSARRQQQNRHASLALLRDGVLSVEGKRLMASIEQLQSVYEGPEADYLRMVEAHRPADARSLLLATMRPAQLELLNGIEAFTQFQKTRMADAATTMQATAVRAEAFVLAIGLASLVVALVAGTLLARSIVRPIGQALRVAETVAKGDLSCAVPEGRRDETGRLLDALRTMTANLLRTVGEVRRSSESIATGSSQIATGNADLSQRTEEQASNLQQTAASMEQLHVTVRQSAATSVEANRLAQAAGVVAAESGAVVERFVGTMNDIGASSRRIADIVGVIDGIAFQTNILALNAAVEAARAGEQGRGFAVVAGEVRTLAHRSATAAKEIKGLIEDSASKVDAGTLLVAEAGQKIGDLVGQVQRVGGLVGEISAAAGEQSTGISQVNDAVAQLDQVTQQNAALVEESAAAAESLRQQSERLVATVAVFRTEAATAGV